MTSCRLILLSVLLACAASVRAAEPAAPPPAPAGYPLETYAAVGSLFAQTTRLADVGWNEAQFDSFITGVRAAFQGKPHPLDARAQELYVAIGRRIQQVAQAEARARRDFFADPARLESYMKETSKNFHMERADSGLAYVFLSQGNGSRPGPEDTVVVSYKVTAADAKTDLPELTVQQKRCKVTELLPGLAEAVQMMTPGSAAMLILPPDLSYGTGAWPPGVDRGAPLLFMLVVEQVISAT